MEYHLRQEWRHDSGNPVGEISVTVTVRGLRPRQVMFPDQHRTANGQQSRVWSILGTKASAAPMGSRATSPRRVCLFFLSFIDVEFMPCTITLV